MFAKRLKRKYIWAYMYGGVVPHWVHVRAQEMFPEPRCYNVG